MTGWAPCQSTDVLEAVASLSGQRGLSVLSCPNKMAGRRRLWPWSDGEQPLYARMVFRGIGVSAALVATIAVICWDVINVGIPPSNIEWALLFTAANVAVLVGGRYAFY